MSRKTIRWAFVLLSILPLTGPRAFAQQPAAPDYQDTTALPEGQMGTRIKSLIEVLNSGNVDRFKRYLDEECAKEFRESVPLDDHISTALGFLRDTGGVDFYSVRTYTPEQPGATVVIVKDRILGSWWGLSFRFGEAPKFLVAGLEMNSARPPVGQPAPPLSEKEAIDEIRALMAGLHKKDWFSGTVLVAKGPNVLLTDFAGEANKGDPCP